MRTTTTETMRVPGASLYYEVRGAGPVLLILQGGPGNAGGTGGIVERLAGDFTVVTYDRRGLSRSTPDDPAGSPGLATHRDDAHRLLAALTTEPAFVFGASIGALLGLDLVAHHPSQVRTLVAHEPPATQLLPGAERDRARQATEDVLATYHREGTAAAMAKFIALSGVDFTNREPGVELPRPTSQTDADREFFLTHDAPAAGRHRLDTDALQATRTRIVPATGREAAGYFPHAARRSWHACSGRNPRRSPAATRVS